MAEVMYQLAFIQIMLKNISKDFNLNLKSATIIQYTIKGRFMSR